MHNKPKDLFSLSLKKYTEMLVSPVAVAFSRTSEPMSSPTIQLLTRTLTTEFSILPWFYPPAGFNIDFYEFDTFLPWDYGKGEVNV